MCETDESVVKERVVNDFNRVVSATSEFLKAVFPHGYSLMKKLKSKEEEEAKES